jgi:class 3 adenylate cyclase/HAMP domain-containing protein
VENNLDEIDVLKNNFLSFEHKFEKHKYSIVKDNTKDFLDYFLNDIHEDEAIKKSLTKLYVNEQIIENIFDEIYDYQKYKLKNIESFEKHYPDENNRRSILQKEIFNFQNLVLIQEFGNLKYYSKETLYQHRDEQRLQKWIKSIDNIVLELNDKNQQSLIDNFVEYKKVVIAISNMAINIKSAEQKEEILILKLREILKENKLESNFIKNSINQVTNNYLNNISIVQFTLIFIIIVLAIFIISYILRKLTSIIEKLNSGVKQLQDGDYEVTINIDEDREFNEVAKTFNNMAKNIKDNKDTLEERIEKRTAQLQNALKDIQAQKNILENLSSKLAKYLSPQVFESIFTGKQDVKLNSKRKYLTVFFSDIKGFTELTDTIETETLTQILNEYLDVMSQIAIKHGGTIDKYIGDCIMVFFGDPNSNGKIVDAINCLSMAIEMKSSMTALRMRWHRDGLSNPFSVRMGINSGYCTVGNFGSKNRMDYTIVGGVVNLASRLESNANPNEILISSETYSLVKDNIECVKKDEITVKGISHKVQTYEVISDKHKSTIIEEKKGFNLIIDLNEIDKDKVIEYLENKINYFRDIK